MPKNTIDPQTPTQVETLRSLALEQLCCPPSGGPGMKAENLLNGMKEVSLDDKGRLYIPTSFREQLGSTLYVFAPPGEKALWIFAETEWKALTGTAAEQARRPLNKSEPLKTFTILLHRSERVDVDSAYRIQLPAGLLNAAGLRKGEEALLLGSGNFLEILPVSTRK